MAVETFAATVAEKTLSLHANASQRCPEVIITTQTTPAFSQKLLGKISPISPNLDEFRGIPYGTTPARWRHSTVRQKLPTDVFNATKNGPRCPQPEGPNNTATYQSHLDFPADVEESELDCLNLFITRPCKDALLKAGIRSSNLPVYFYIHGGGYGFGAATDPMWDPAYLVNCSLEKRKPFIAVLVNYRLGLFGFAASPDMIAAQTGDAVQGCNFGLGDQRTALEWVSKHISAFGGDPNKIAIGGQSAGASSAHSHILEAKYSRNPPLFRRGIIQSAAVGTLGPISMSEAHRNWMALAEKFCIPQDAKPITRWEVLSRIPTIQLLESGLSLGWMVYPLVNDGLTISARGRTSWNVQLRQSSPEALSSSADSGQSIDVFIGDTDAEASIHHDLVLSIHTCSDFQQLLSFVIPSDSFCKDVLAMYGIGEGVTAQDLQTSITQFLTDIEFGLPVQRARDDLIAANNVCLKGKNSSGSAQNQSLYQIKVKSYRIKFGNPWSGQFRNIAQHCVDVIYLFDAFHRDLRKIDTDGTNEQLVRTIQTHWIDFIFDDDVPGNDESMLVYEQNRSVRSVMVAEDPELVDRMKRFERLERHWDEAVMIAHALMDSSL